MARSHAANTAQTRLAVEEAVGPADRLAAALLHLDAALTGRDASLAHIVLDRAADQVLALADIVLASAVVGAADVSGMRYLPPHLEDPDQLGWLRPEELRRRRRSWQKSKTRTLFYAEILAGEHRCALCGCAPAHLGGPACLVVDHVIPLARGGTNNDANLQVLCEPCNARKGATLR